MGPKVQTLLGGLEGEQRGAHQAFLGVPYAAATVGERPAPDVERLSANMMDAWIAFAETGNSSHEGIGRWQPHSAAQRRTAPDDGVRRRVQPCQRPVR